MSDKKQKELEEQKAKELEEQKAKELEATTNIKELEKHPDPVEVEKEKVLIFKAKKPLTPAQFDALYGFLMKEQEATGLKIILLPYSAEYAGQE